MRQPQLYGRQGSHAPNTSSSLPKKKPATKLNRLRSTINVMTSTPWNRYVQVPSVKNGNTSDTAYGKLDTGEMPSPAYTVTATAKLLMSTASTSASSPRTTILSFISISSSSIHKSHTHYTPLLGARQALSVCQSARPHFQTERPVCNTMLLFCSVCRIISTLYQERTFPL